jgi:hypothetical protein
MVPLPPDFLAGWPPYSLIAQSNASSPQAKALAWLHADIQSSEYPYPLYRMYQRYALAVFFYSTNGESWINSGQWLSNTLECYWYMEWSDPDFCGAGWRVAYLSFSTNNLSGTLPTELQLLSNLENIQIGLLPDYNDVSGEIYTEL